MKPWFEFAKIWSLSLFLVGSPSGHAMGAAGVWYVMVTALLSVATEKQCSPLLYRYVWGRAIIYFEYSFVFHVLCAPNLHFLCQIVAGEPVGPDAAGGAGGVHVQSLHGCPLPPPGYCRSPYRLVHPWESTLQVRCVNSELNFISFSATFLRLQVCWELLRPSCPQSPSLGKQLHLTYETLSRKFWGLYDQTPKSNQLP